MERRKHDPRDSLPCPGIYATRIGYRTGDVVTYNHQAVYVSAVVDFRQPLAPSQVLGRCYILHGTHWPHNHFVIVPVAEIDQPRFYAA